MAKQHQIILDNEQKVLNAARERIIQIKKDEMEFVKLQRKEKKYSRL